MVTTDGVRVEVDDRNLKMALNRLNSEIQNVVIEFLKKEALTWQREIKQKITDNGSVVTGDLRRSISVQNKEKWEYLIGTNLFYAPFVEYGTRRMGAKPYMTPIYEKRKEIFEEDLKRVLREALR